jgi:hypothetical protein
VGLLHSVDIVLNIPKYNDRRILWSFGPKLDLYFGSNRLVLRLGTTKLTTLLA